MNIVDLNIYVATVLVVILSLVAGYAGEKVEPSDAATLLVAIRMTEARGSDMYMTPGQLATILLPRQTRRVRSLSRLASLSIIAIALLTHWWLMIFGYVVGQVMVSVTRNLFANRSLDHNCFWIFADLDCRKSEFETKGDLGKAEAAAELMEELIPIWEAAHMEDEPVPRRTDLMEIYGARATL